MVRRDLTKEQSSVMQGIAVLLMMYHHLFLDLRIYDNRLFIWNTMIVCRIAWFGKISVAIYAFISGYGMYFVLKKNQKQTLFLRICTDFQMVLKQIFRVYIKFFLVFLLYVGVAVFTGEIKFQWFEFLTNALTLSCTYQSTWWYMGQYIKMMLLLPLLEVFCFHFEDRSERKRKWILYGSFIVIGVLIIGAGLVKYHSWLGFVLQVIKELKISFFLPFCIGYVMAKEHIYDRIFSMTEKQKNRTGIIAFFILIPVIGIRIILSTYPAYAETDFLLVPFFVYAVLALLENCRKAKRVLTFFGGKSVYIWLSHGWILAKFGQNLAGFLHWHLLYYILFVILSVLLACFLDKFMKFTMHSIKSERGHER